MKSTFKIFLLFNALTAAASLAAQDYLWPTNSSTLMSSSFCEFRDGHYHSAIDIKTWLREGYPCYAIADGYIERIRISPFGYGKVLYLKLDDGNKAVYAHLQGFTPALEKTIRQFQINNQKYRVDWYPVNLRVKRGDIIAYTGSTGTGLPHLHFEIRSKKNRPLNPLSYYPAFKDKIRPRLDKLAVIPLSYDTRINGNSLPQVFQLSYIRDGIYVIKKPLRASGLIGLAIKGYDQADGAANKYGFYDTQLEIDGELAFQITYDELNFAQTHHIYTETYYPFWADSQQVFHKLYIEHFNPLTFYRNIPSQDGTLTINEIPRQFTVVVHDFHGNKSVIRGEVMPDELMPVHIVRRQYSGQQLYIDFQRLPLRDLQFYYGQNLNQMQQVSYFELMDAVQGNPDSIIRSKVLLPDTLQNYVKMIAKTQNNQTVRRIIPLREQQQISPTLRFLDKRLIMDIKDAFVGSTLNLKIQSQKYRFYETADGIAQVVVPAANFISSPANFHITRDDIPVWSADMPVHVIFPERKTEISWFDSALTLTVPADAVLDTFLISAVRYAADSISAILPVASPIYEIFPDNIPLFRSFSLRLSADSLPQWGKWHVYQTDGDKSLSFLSALTDTTRLTVEAFNKSFGKFVVAADTVPPLIKIRAPVPGAIYRTNPQIKFELDDEFSGIGHEENISVLIDGEFVLPEWDPEEKIVRATIDTALEPGIHSLSVSVTDQAGNISRQALMFEIK